jgi:hypothetical protein
MSTETPAPASSHSSTAPARGGVSWHLVRHYVEMVVAMVVGMVALDPVWSLVWPGWTTTTEVHVLGMATNMALGMGAWMAFRRHSWRSIAEMSASMYLPFVVLLVPYWAGGVSGGTVMTAGHVLMLATMAAAMLWRRAEYAH